jgi:hypothetical protein
MLPYKIHQFDGEEFDLSKTIPAYTKYCGYDYCIQEYNSQTFPIPVQNIFQFSKPAYLKDGYYRLYSKEFDLERSRNYKYFKNGEVYIQDSYSYRFEWGLSEYTRGFLEGYNESFIPFIDTPQTRIEMIVKAAIVRPEFVNIQTDNSRVVKMYCVYSQGLKEGRRYKAWGIIEKSPNAFVDYFKKPSSHQSMILQENSEAINLAAEKQPKSNTFTEYLKCKEENKSNVIEFIKNEISKTQKINVLMASLTAALQEKSYLPYIDNKTAYFAALYNEFKTVGTRNKFNERYNEKDLYKSKIDDLIKRIP